MRPALRAQSGNKILRAGNAEEKFESDNRRRGDLVTGLAVTLKSSQRKGDESHASSPLFAIGLADLCQESMRGYLL
jgi:hypothetical protein